MPERTLELAPTRDAAMYRFAATIFLSAFLLFQVQPLAGRFVLPWFGGGPGVWTACMLLFQVLLLAGYAYAHFVSTRLSRRRQGWLHGSLLALSLLMLPIIPDASWKPHGGDAPTLRIVLLLASTIGLPYFLLSTTGPLVQTWFAAKHPDRSPFRLYALSNVGSLLALISYPLVVEPALTLGTQAVVWSALYVAFVLICGWNAFRHAADPLPAVPLSLLSHETRFCPLETSRISRGTKFLWLLLAGTASVLLLATTNQLCQQVAVTPFLWIVPLAIYLVSFILTFDAPRWYRRDVFGPLLALSSVAAWYVVDNGPAVRLDVQLVVYCTALFAATMVCHGELVRLKPHATQLTLFYLFIAIGGALGGVLTACVAPFFFAGYWEYQLGLGGACVLLLVCMDRDRHCPLYRMQPFWAWCVMGCGTVAFLAALGKQALGHDNAKLSAARNFYGVLTVIERDQPGVGPQVAMTHGRIVHGVQFRDEAKRSRPTAYYGPESGVGVAIQFFHSPSALRCPRAGLNFGVIGLGAGTIATYGQTLDSIDFYEINPDVERLAREHFRYLADSQADVRVVLGDARITLEEAVANGTLSQGTKGTNGPYDVFVVDAFSGDAIPMHLLTRECFYLYRRVLRDDGLLVLHISNDHVDLTPVVRGLAAELGWEVRAVQSKDDPAAGTQRSDWLIVTQNREFLNDPAAAAHFQPLLLDRAPIVWTDDFGSLRQVLK